MRYIIDPPIQTIEAIEPAKTGYLGGFNLPVINFMANWRIISSASCICYNW